MNKDTSLFVLYDPSQVDELVRYRAKHTDQMSDLTIIAFGLDVEQELAEHGFPFESARSFRHMDPQLLDNEDHVMNKFFSHPGWQKLSYRNIPLPDTFLFMFRAYLQRVGYYSNLLISVLERHPSPQQLLMFAPLIGFVPELAGLLAPREATVVIDCAQLIARDKGIPFVLLPVDSLPVRRERALFRLKRALFSALLAMWNTGIDLLPRSRPRILISDYWRNVQPALRHMRTGEYLFLDRMEIRNIPWRMLVRFRMRFVHINHFLTRDGRARVRYAGAELIREWKSLKQLLPRVFSWRGYSLDTLLLQAVEDIVLNVERTLFEIEGVHCLYERTLPNLVILRASVSGQTHFSILPLMARQRGIPSLELQHGLEYLGAGSWSRNHAAEYLAVYGPLIQQEFIKLGYRSDTIRAVGSPRFDGYRPPDALKLKESQALTMLCIAPDIRPFIPYDSYAAEEYFGAVAEAVRHTPELRVIVKIRAGTAGETLMRKIIARTFGGTSYTIAQNESLADLFGNVHVVVSCFSTAILESMCYGLPVVIPALNPIDAAIVDFHFAPYAAASAVFTPHSHHELNETVFSLAASTDERARIRENIKIFLDGHYCFDGNAGKRVAALIDELASQRPSP